MLGGLDYHSINAAVRRALLGLLDVGSSSLFAPSALGYNLVAGYLEWSVSGSVLTCAVKTSSGNDPSAGEPVWYAVRDVTASTGALVYRKLTAALSVTVNNTALAGTVNGVPFRLWAAIFNDGGTDRLAVINCLSSAAGPGAGRDITAIFPLAGFGIGTTVLSDNAADNAQVFYANAATASKGYTTVGYATWEAGLVAAGVWSAGPTRKQLFGPGVPLPGQVIQVQRNDTGAYASGTTQIPFDDTIPQITEGDQYMSQVVTPSSAANVLALLVAWNGSPGGAGHLTVALFQDATLNALKAVSAAGIDESLLVQTLDALVLAAGTAATTFKVRAGVNVAGTTEFNGRTAGRQLGGVFASHLAVSEIMA